MRYWFGCRWRPSVARTCTPLQDAGPHRCRAYWVTKRLGVLLAPTQVRDAYGNPLHEGDRVTWSIMAACGTCEYCNRRNLPQKCEKLFKYGHARSEAPYFFNGGFAEGICLRSGTSIYRIPDAVSDIEAVPLNCALATVLGGLATLDLTGRSSAVVQGAGMLGIYAACCLR